MNSIIVGDYEFKERTKSGPFSSVYRAIHQPTESAVAIKKIHKLLFDTEKKKKDFLNRVENLKSLHHPFIVEFIDFFEFGDFYYLVMEYLPNGTLHDFIKKNKKLEESDAKTLFIQVISVLNYLHFERHFVHRDLKTQNIMLDRHYNIRLIDFGISKTFQSNYSSFYTVCESSQYATPEVILGQPYTTKCEIWCSGIILYEMVCGILPFNDKNRDNLFEQIKNNEPNYDGISQDLRCLIQNLLKKNPNKRISLSEIKKNFSFLFLNKIN
jgi:serine/threonine protein kinase